MPPVYRARPFPAPARRHSLICHAEERNRTGTVHRPLQRRLVFKAAPQVSRGAVMADPARWVYWFSLVCPMISLAVKLMPQVGKELPTKKLSDWSGK